MLEVPAVPAQDLAGEDGAESSEAIRDRVLAARRRQEERRKESGVHVNAELHGRSVWRFCRPEPAGRRLLDAAVRRLGLSARAYHRVLKVSRTIADLAGASMPGADHVAEALQYRVEDRG